MVWEERPLQVSLANQEVEYDLIAQEVESAEYRRECPVLILLERVQGAWCYTCRGVR